jgi:hypothetical protein
LAAKVRRLSSKREEETGNPPRPHQPPQPVNTFFLRNRVDISFIFLVITAHVTKTSSKKVKITV